MRAASEAKVGFVVVLALVVMGGGYLFLRGMALGADTYHLRLATPAAIATGSDVRLQGVKIGQVQDVTLDPETQKPLLTLAIKRNHPAFKLLKHYHYTIRSNSLIGENFVDIRGQFDPAGPLFTPNDPGEVIHGTAIVGITDVTEIASSIGKDFGVTLQKLNVTLDRINKGVLSYDNQVKLASALDGVAQLTRQAGKGFGPQGIKFGFGDPRAQNSLNSALGDAAFAAREARSMVGEAHGAARNMNDLTIQFKAITEENRGQLRGLLNNMSSAAASVAGLTQSLGFFLHDSGFRENSQVALQAMRKAAENVEAGTAGFKSMAGDPKTQEDLKATLAALRVASESLRDTSNVIKAAVSDPATQEQLSATLKVLTSTATSLQTTMSNLNEASIGLKNIVGDPQLQASVKASADNLNGTLAATRAAAERVNSLLGGKRAKPADAGTGAAKVTPISTLPQGVDFTYRHLGNFKGRPRVGSDVYGSSYGDLTFNNEFFGAPFRLGLANIGDGTDLTLQTGKFIGKDAAARYGLYRSKLGVGAEVHKGRFSLEGNLWDPNGHSANAYLGLQLTPQAEILVGHEDIRGVHSTSIGVRLRP